MTREDTAPQQIIIMLTVSARRGITAAQLQSSVVEAAQRLVNSAQQIVDNHELGCDNEPNVIDPATIPIEDEEITNQVWVRSFDTALPERGIR